MDVDKDCEIDFQQEQWVAKGKSFQEAPHYIKNACRMAIAIPADHTKQLPLQSISIHDLCNYKLPVQSQEICHIATHSWFSQSNPNSTLEGVYLRDRELPAKQLLEDLVNHSGQAILNGMTYIVDCRYKNVILPLGVLGLWQDLSKLLQIQHQWKEARTWLLEQRLSRMLGPSTISIIETALHRLHELHWDQGVVTPGHDSITYDVPISTMSLFIRQHWLNGNLVDMMVDTLNKRLAKEDGQNGRISILPLSFSWKLESLANEKNYAPELQKVMVFYKQTVIDGKTLFYFPLNIGNYHWIAFEVDFEVRSIRYGAALKILVLLLGTHFPMTAVVLQGIQSEIMDVNHQNSFAPYRNG